MDPQTGECDSESLPVGQQQTSATTPLSHDNSADGFIRDHTKNDAAGEGCVEEVGQEEAQYEEDEDEDGEGEEGEEDDDGEGEESEDEEEQEDDEECQGAEEHEEHAEGEEEMEEGLCKDIRGEMADILCSDLEVTSAFSFSRVYPEAPNPSLNIDGLGTVGLPLSIRDAAAIKMCAESVPSDTAYRTVGDMSKQGTGTWEIDASKVHFENQVWSTFMNKTVRDVCEVLGVDFQRSQPRCELNKLRLYEAGSGSLPRMDTNTEVDGLIACIVVVLPSRFTGGAVRLAHGKLSETYDNSAGSLTTTSVLAWYTGVEHATTHVTSGCRLVLSFNLIHTTNVLRPTLSSEKGIVASLRRLLQSWDRNQGSDNPSEAPHKLIYLLSNKYSGELRRSALKGVDSDLVTLLDDIGKPHGLHLGLASLRCTESGYGGGRAYGGRGRWIRTGWDSDDDGDVTMDEVDETEVTVDGLVDLDGRLIQQELEHNLDTEVIPVNLVDEVTSGEYDDQDYDRERGTGGGSLSRWYYGTVLVIWPHWANHDIMCGADGLSYACERLRVSTSFQPTSEESELAGLILARASTSHSTAVVSSLCRAAVKWKDHSLWKQAVTCCDAPRSIAAFGGEHHIYSAVAAFGFQNIKPFLEQALEREPSNIVVLQFLDRLEIWVMDQQDAPSHQVTSEWIAAQRAKRFASLKKPKKDEHGRLTELAIKCGGVAFLESHVLPLIKPEADSSVLLDYARYMYHEPSIPEEARSRIARDLLLTSILKLDIYSVPIQPTQRHAAPYASTYPPQTFEEPKQLERVKTYVKACFDLQCEDLFSKVVGKLVDRTNVARDVIGCRVKHIFLPLIVYARPMVRGSALSELHRLCRLAAKQWVSNVAVNPRGITTADISSLFNAMISGGQPGIILTELLPKLEATALDNTQLRALVQDLHARRAELDIAGHDVQTVIMRLLRKWASTAPLTGWTYAGYYSGAAHAGRSFPAIDALEFCFSVHAPDACTFILTRILNSTKLDGKYVQEQLAPLVPQLRTFLLKHEQPLTSSVYAPVFRSILQLWVQKVMGTRPPDMPSVYLQNLQRWGCTCDTCRAVRRFLTSSPNETRSWDRIGAPTRKHVESFLQTHAHGVATWDMIRTVPQGIRVTKSKVLIDPSRYAYYQNEGSKLLNSLSTNDTELQGILGQDYARTAALLQGRTPSANASTAVSIGSDTYRAAASRTGVASKPPPPSGSVPRLPQVAKTKVAAAARTPHTQPHTVHSLAGTSRSHAQMSGAPTSSSVEHGPPAKRRKTAYDMGSVIDLT